MKLRKRILSLLLAGAMVLSLTACGGTKEEAQPEPEVAETVEEAAEEPAAEEAEEPKTGTHVVVDHLGLEVEVPYEIDKIAVGNILPLASVLTVFFDSAEKLVGMPPNSMAAAKNGLLGELYPEILDVETGYMEGTEINLEELMKLEPDIVIYSASQPAQGEQLKNAGIPAIALSVNKWEYNAIETLSQWISLLSEIFPDNDKTEVVEKYSNEVYEMIQERVADIPEEERERVMFLFKYTDTVLETSGKKFFGQFWAEAVGAKNVGEGIDKDNGVAINMEQVYEWNPSMIFVTNFNTAQPKDIYENTIGNYDWSAVEAVQNEKVYKMPLGMYRGYLPGADTPVTLLWFAKTTYPELFKDIDIVEEAKEYYKEVFGIELTDEQVTSVFSPDTAAGAVFN